MEKNKFMYKILFKSRENRLIKKWVSVEHITSQTQSTENRKKIRSFNENCSETAETVTQEEILHTKICYPDTGR